MNFRVDREEKWKARTLLILQCEFKGEKSITYVCEAGFLYQKKSLNSIQL